MIGSPPRRTALAAHTGASLISEGPDGDVSRSGSSRGRDEALGFGWLNRYKEEMVMARHGQQSTEFELIRRHFNRRQVLKSAAVGAGVAVAPMFGSLPGASAQGVTLK